MNPKGCTRFTVQDLIEPIFEKNHITIEYPEAKFPTTFDCNSLKVVFTYLNDNKGYDIIKIFNSSSFIHQKNRRRCFFKLPLSELYQNKKYEKVKDQPAIYDINSADYDLIRFVIEITGMPQGARFNRYLDTNFEISQAGHSYGFQKSESCDRSSTFYDDFKIQKYT